MTEGQIIAIDGDGDSRRTAYLEDGIVTVETNGSPDILGPGTRVFAGHGEDHDHGEIVEIRDDGMAIVAWDSCATTQHYVLALEIEPDGRTRWRCPECILAVHVEFSDGDPSESFGTFEEAERRLLRGGYHRGATYTGEDGETVTEYWYSTEDAMAEQAVPSPACIVEG